MRADPGLPLNGPAPVERIRPTGVVVDRLPSHSFFYTGPKFSGLTLFGLNCGRRPGALPSRGARNPGGSRAGTDPVGHRFQ